MPGVVIIEGYVLIEIALPLVTVSSCSVPAWSDSVITASEAEAEAAEPRIGIHVAIQQVLSDTCVLMQTRRQRRYCPTGVR